MDLRFFVRDSSFWVSFIGVVLGDDLVEVPFVGDDAVHLRGLRFLSSSQLPFLEAEACIDGDSTGESRAAVNLTREDFAGEYRTGEDFTREDFRGEDLIGEDSTRDNFTDFGFSSRYVISTSFSKPSARYL